MRVLVLSARPYDFKDDSGRQVAGATVAYITGEPSGDREKSGVDVFQTSVELRAYQTLDQVPAIYEMACGMRPAPGGKGVQLRIERFAFVAPYDIAAVRDAVA
jgi:hypothetical protein